MKEALYTLTSDFLAPRADSVDPSVARSFAAGDQVQGYLYEGENADNSNPIVIVFGEFAIPTYYLTKVAELDENGQPIPIIPKSEFQQQTEDLKEELMSITKNNIVKNIVEKSRQSVNGMLIGGAIGGVTFLIAKKSLFWGIVLGATIGGLIASNIKINLKEPKITES